MSYRCYRDAFTADQYGQYHQSFWAMPTSWSYHDGRTMLASLRHLGGLGTLAVLPVLGQFAHVKKSGGWFLSQEELSRLAGIDPGTAAKARVSLAQANLADAVIGIRYGCRMLRWSLKPGLAAQRDDSGFVESRFYFAAKISYGGKLVAAYCDAAGHLPRRRVALASPSRALPHALCFHSRDRCRNFCGARRQAARRGSRPRARTHSRDENALARSA